MWSLCEGLFFSIKTWMGWVGLVCFSNHHWPLFYCMVFGGSTWASFWASFFCRELSLPKGLLLAGWARRFWRSSARSWASALGGKRLDVTTPWGWNPWPPFFIGWFPSFTVIFVGFLIIQKEPPFFSMVVDLECMVQRKMGPDPIVLAKLLGPKLKVKLKGRSVGIRGDSKDRPSSSSPFKHPALFQPYVLPFLPQSFIKSGKWGVSKMSFLQQLR